MRFRPPVSLFAKHLYQNIIRNCANWHLIVTLLNNKLILCSFIGIKTIGEDGGRGQKIQYIGEAYDILEIGTAAFIGAPKKSDPVGLVRDPGLAPVSTSVV